MDKIGVAGLRNRRFHIFGAMALSVKAMENGIQFVTSRVDKSLLVAYRSNVQKINPLSAVTDKPNMKNNKPAAIVGIMILNV